MFIRFFQNSYLPQYIFFFIFALALWMPTFINPPYINAQSPNTPLYNVLIQITNSKLIWAFLAFSILLLQSLFFNLILTNNEFIRRTSLIGGFLYFVLMSHHASLQHFYPALMSHFFILLTIHFLLNMYGKETVLRDSFRLGFYIGIASLFYFPSFFFMALVYTTLLVFRVSYWRQWVIPTFSFFTPYIFLFTYYFVSDKLPIVDLYFTNFFNEFSIVLPNYNSLSLVIALALGLIFLFAFLTIFTRNSEKNIHNRKKTLIFLNLLIISIVSLLTTKTNMMSFTTYIIPIALIMAIYFNDLQKKRWVDIFFTITMILILINIY